MVRLIVNIIFFLILASFIAINAQYTTSVNLYGYKLEDISLISVIIVALAAGILYSFSFYLVNYLIKQKSKKMKKMKNQNQEKEIELKQKEMLITDTAKPADSPPKKSRKKGKVDSKKEPEQKPPDVPDGSDSGPMTF